MCAGINIEELELASRTSNQQNYGIKDCKWADFYWGSVIKQEKNDSFDLEMGNLKLEIIDS